MLLQCQDNGKPHPVIFASCSIVTDLKTLAVVWAVSYFRIYLYGQKVTVYTDHAAVKAIPMLAEDMPDGGSKFVEVA